MFNKGMELKVACHGLLGCHVQLHVVLVKGTGTEIATEVHPVISNSIGIEATVIKMWHVLAGLTGQTGVIAVQDVMVELNHVRVNVHLASALAMTKTNNNVTNTPVQTDSFTGRIIIE